MMVHSNTAQKADKVTPDKNLDILPNGIVLIDDDKAYQRLFAAAGKSMGVRVITYGSLAEMVSIAHLNKFDMAIIDYHLESFTGTEIAEYVDAFFPDLPVFLISGDDNVFDADHSPASIKRFFSKASGPYSIINESISALERIKFYMDLRQKI